MVSRRHRDRPAAHPHRRLHGRDLLPLALRTGPITAGDFHQPRGRDLQPPSPPDAGRDHRGHVRPAVAGAAMAAARNTALPRQRPQRPRPAEPPVPPLRDAVAGPTDRRRRSRGSKVPRDAIDPARLRTRGGYPPASPLAGHPPGFSPFRPPPAPLFTPH